MGGHPWKRTASFLGAVEWAAEVLKSIGRRRDQLSPTRTRIPLHLTLEMASIRSISRAVDYADNNGAGEDAQVSEQLCETNKRLNWLKSV